MDKVNEFETAADLSYSKLPFRPRFSDEAREHYTFSSADSLLEDMLNISEMIKHHQEHQRPRLDMLDDYYEGNNNGILRKNRRKEVHLADHRSPHNFAEYVSQFIQGYMVGVPIKVQHDDETVSDKLNELSDQTDADAHNSDLILDLSIYGRAYELIYRNMDDESHLALLSPLETFVVYSNTVEKKPLAAVRYYTTVTGKEETHVEVYTDKDIIYYTAKDIHSYHLDEESRKEHYFGGVPIVEYSNNRFRQGDYEKVLYLIDLYDAAQSDTANYMTDLNDAMLKITGNLEIDVEEARNMKDANILFLKAEPSVDGRESKVDADYIYKKYDVAGVEKYKDRIANDIHKFTNTPDMGDSQFAGTQSGIAMVYKLFGLEQKRAIKERLFKRSMMQRYRLIKNILRFANEGDFDIHGLKITFTPNLPENIAEELDMFVNAGGVLSQETLLSMLSTVSDPKEELERIAAEMAENQNSLLSTYSFAPTSAGGANGSEE